MNWSKRLYQSDVIIVATGAKLRPFALIGRNTLALLVWPRERRLQCFTPAICDLL